MNNPYADMISMIKKHGAAYNPPAVTLGQVISSKPLTITIGDLQLTEEDIYISDLLLNNYKRRIKLPTTDATGTTTEESIKTIGIKDAELDFTDGIDAGDTVAVMATEDRQTYIILCKVVRP
ncbi:DUF2577 domain-containing protein [Clostridium oryzae]|uniref:DUF2577 domain-containing protein n=1 Tax=Clostridium oryzae TaxID=1450648 RepID=A0A1V4IF05_9CLOT|nr:DUF2577 domain-containing protein [Clostridium oryzae]OPJ58434.1 hypothetical protein CLORY_35840 [Clostridium oryzae]